MTLKPYLSNLKPDPTDTRDYLFTTSTYGLPESADLRQWANEIEHQGSTNSCTANAGVSACEIWSARSNDKKDFSRLFLYWNEREEYSNLRGVDGGAYMRDICKSLREEGVCLESTWPFYAGNVNTKPPEHCYTEAAKWKVNRYERINHNQPELIKAALAKGYPVLVGMMLRQPFFGVPKVDQFNYFINTGYSTALVVGSHAMLIVGYDDAKQHWIIENSWGNGWGDNGYVYMPYGFFNIDVHDVWVFTEFGGYQMPELWKQTYANENQAMIGRLYKTVFDRLPDQAGLEYWTNKLNEMSLRQIAAEFMASGEFQAKYGAVNDEGFVNLLYNNVLKRDADAAGKTHWMLHLNPPTRIDRVDVLLSFSESDENKRSNVNAPEEKGFLSSLFAWFK